MEYLLPYFNIVTVPHQMVRLERMSDYRDVSPYTCLQVLVYCTQIGTYRLVLELNHTAVFTIKPKMTAKERSTRVTVCHRILRTIILTIKGHISNI